MLVRLALDDADPPVVLTGIRTAVPHVQKLSLGIVGDTVGTKVQLDRIQQVERVAAEYAEHAVISTRDEDLIKGWNVSDTWGFLKTRNVFQPFAGLEIAPF